MARGLRGPDRAEYSLGCLFFFFPKVRFQLDQHVKCPSRRGGRDAVVQPGSWQAVKCDECRVPEALAGRSTLTFLLE